MEKVFVLNSSPIIFIRNLQDAIDAIKSTGLYLNDNVIKDILQEVDA